MRHQCDNPDCPDCWPDGPDPEGWAWPYAFLALLAFAAFVIWYTG